MLIEKLKNNLRDDDENCFVVMSKDEMCDALNSLWSEVDSSVDSLTEIGLIKVVRYKNEKRIYIYVPEDWEP